MFTYFLNTISIFFLMYVNKNIWLFIWILFSVSIILYFLPSTGDDYDYYKGYYDNSYIDSIFPYLHSNFSLTAEPFYQFYTSFINVVTHLSFNGFLVLNFLLCSFLLFKILRKLFTREAITIFFIFSLLTIVPTIYYFSPRSSISFIFAVFAFIFYVKEQTFKGLLFSFICIGFHSQFIPILFILFLTNIYNKKVLNQTNQKTKYIIFFMILIVMILTLTLKYPLLIYSVISSIVSSLPSGALIESKLHYFEDARNSFRMTSILSIIIFPLIYYVIVKNKFLHKIFRKNISEKDKNNFILFFGISILFGVLVNILLFNYSHVAGRLSRFSDYFFMMIGLATFFMGMKQKYILLPIFLILFSILSIVVYKSLYNFNLSIF